MSSARRNRHGIGNPVHYHGRGSLIKRAITELTPGRANTELTLVINAPASNHAVSSQGAGMTFTRREHRRSAAPFARDIREAPDGLRLNGLINESARSG